MVGNIDKNKLPFGVEYVRTFQGIDELVLDNGLRILLFEDASQANVTVNITYLVGSRHEGRGEAGMAHLLEHMLFRGTKDMRDVKGALQDRGAQFNATTWFDRTNYFETLTPTTDNLEFALRLEADRMINSLILQEDLDSEMTVVRNEFEMGENNPIHVLHDQLMSSAYRWHNYGKTTIGNRSDIERVPVKSLRKFYEHYYQPDNAVLVVAGQFKSDVAIQQINTHFGSIKKPNRILDQTYTEEPAQDGPKDVELLRAGDMASVAVGYHIPAASHVDHAPLKILFDAVTDEPSGILYQNLVESKKSSEVFSMTYALYEPGMALCFVRPSSKESAYDIRDQLIALLEDGAPSLISHEQVERMKIRALKKIKLAMANSKDLALKLSESIACGDWRLFFWYRDQIKRVNLEDVNRVKATYLLQSNRTSGVFLPTSEPKRVAIGKPVAIASFIDQVEDDPSLSTGDAFVASVSSIENAVRRQDLSPERKLAALTKKTRGQIARAQVKIRFGTPALLQPWIKEFWVIPSLLWRGTTKYDYQAIRDRIDNLMSAMEIDGHAGMLSFSIKSERQHLNDMLSLVADICQDSAFKADEFLMVRQREIDNYEEIRSDPQRVSFHELERLRNPWPKDHILYVHSYDEIVDGLKHMSVKNVRSAYDSAFSLNHFNLSLVGDCEVDQAISMLNGEFKASSSMVPYERTKRPFIKNIADDVILDTPDKEMAIIAYG